MCDQRCSTHSVATGGPVGDPRRRGETTSQAQDQACEPWSSQAMVSGVETQRFRGRRFPKGTRTCPGTRDHEGLYSDSPLPEFSWPLGRVFPGRPLTQNGNRAGPQSLAVLVWSGSQHQHHLPLGAADRCRVSGPTLHACMGSAF